MRFDIAERDGLARTGLLELDGKTYSTPAIVFARTDRYSAPEGALTAELATETTGRAALLVAPSLYGESEAGPVAQLRPGSRGSPYAPPSDEGNLALLANTASLMLDSSKFVDSLAAMKAGPAFLRPAYCSVMGLPHRLAFLSYCGFDLFDSLPLIMASESGSYLTSTGVLDYSSVKELPCSCPACSSGNRSKDELLRHNYFEAENEVRLIRHTISQGRMRELVEGRVRSDPWLVQNLRLLDIEKSGLQEMHASIRGAPFHAGSKESLSRPDVVRWRKRLEQRYERPKRRKILVLMPCSARKPYSLSQSHIRFRDAIARSGNADAVHEVIITSPIGLVPRELELFYPAKDYDIPVTGHWDSDEKKLVEEMVTWLLETQKYDLVVSHLGDERDTVNAVLKDFVDTSGGHPGSGDSLRKLEETLRERIPKREEERTHSSSLEDMQSLCRFQFGPAGDELCDGARIAGRWPNLKILRGGAQLGMLTGDRGMISLTLDGAAVIAGAGAYRVGIEDFKPIGNLFAVGIESADKEIRVGDDVAVVHRGDVRAVGVARMTPFEMELAERGEAVHIRHAR